MGRAQWKRAGWAAAGLVAVALATLFVWSISASQTERTLEARYRAQDYADRAESRIQRACGSAQPGTMTECVTEQVKATREDQRAEYDLSAQERMADWAFWMMLLTGLTTVLTAVALWFVKGTLDATRKAVDDTATATTAMIAANVIASNATRAWMMLDHIRWSIVRQDIHKGHIVTDGIEFGFEWINAGQSPALGCRFCNMYLFFPKTLPELPFKPQNLDPIGQTVGPGQKHSSGHKMILNDEQAAQLRAQTHRLLLYSRVQYFATLTDAAAAAPLRTTEICYEAICMGTTQTSPDAPQIDNIIFKSFGPQQSVS